VFHVCGKYRERGTTSEALATLLISEEERIVISKNSEKDKNFNGFSFNNANVI
jgi:hypothetical protein